MLCFVFTLYGSLSLPLFRSQLLSCFGWTQRTPNSPSRPLKFSLLSRVKGVLVFRYGLIEQFTKNGITSILNLQNVGEHSSCGFPLDSSGFSYSPETFMENNIFFYNFEWNDYGVRSLQAILDMVQVCAPFSIIAYSIYAICAVKSYQHNREILIRKYREMLEICMKIPCPWKFIPRKIWICSFALST